MDVKLDGNDKIEWRKVDGLPSRFTKSKFTFSFFALGYDDFREAVDKLEASFFTLKCTKQLFSHLVAFGELFLHLFAQRKKMLLAAAVRKNIQLCDAVRENFPLPALPCAQGSAGSGEFSRAATISKFFSRIAKTSSNFLHCANKCERSSLHATQCKKKLHNAS